MDETFTHIISFIHQQLYETGTIIFSTDEELEAHLTSDLPEVTYFRRCQSQDSNSALSNFTTCALYPSAGLPVVFLLGEVLSSWPVVSLTHSYSDPLVILQRHPSPDCSIP